MTALFESRALADTATETLRVFAQPQRLMILSCLLRGERTVGEIDEATSIGQPALSQQLAELRRAELVQTRRAAKQVYYDLADDLVRMRVRAIEAVVTGGGELATKLRDAGDGGPAPMTPARPSGAAAFAQVIR